MAVIPFDRVDQAQQDAGSLVIALRLRLTLAGLHLHHLHPSVRRPIDRSEYPEPSRCVVRVEPGKQLVIRLFGVEILRLVDQWGTRLEPHPDGGPPVVVAVRESGGGFHNPSGRCFVAKRRRQVRQVLFEPGQEFHHGVDPHLRHAGQQAGECGIFPEELQQAARPHPFDECVIERRAPQQAGAEPPAGPPRGQPATRRGGEPAPARAGSPAPQSGSGHVRTRRACLPREAGTPSKALAVAPRPAPQRRARPGEASRSTAEAAPSCHPLPHTAIVRLRWQGHKAGFQPLAKLGGLFDHGQPGIPDCTAMDRFGL